MVETALKFKAVMLLMLFAGAEAARIATVVEFTDVTRSVKEAKADGVPADKQWQTLNRKHCKFRLWKGGCTGKGCSYRPLPLDRSQSDSCRLSNHYMLHSDDSQAYFTELQKAILTEKAEKFKDHCLKNVSAIEIFQKPTLRCLRRASHMLQATEYMMQYQRDMLKSEEAFLGEGQKEAQHSVEQALSTLASSLGEDGHHILEFRKKLVSDPAAIIKDPANSMRQIKVVMYDLMSSNSTTKKVAQEFVANMPTGGEQLTKEDVERLTNKTSSNPESIEEKQDRSLRVIEGAFLGNSRRANEARKLMEKEASSAEGTTALVQINQNQATAFTLNLLKVIVTILWILFIVSLIWSLLLVWAILSSGDVFALLGFAIVFQVLFFIALPAGFALGMHAIWRRWKKKETSLVEAGGSTDEGFQDGSTEEGFEDGSTEEWSEDGSTEGGSDDGEDVSEDETDKDDGIYDTVEDGDAVEDNTDDAAADSTEDGEVVEDTTAVGDEANPSI